MLFIKTLETWDLNLFLPRKLLNLLKHWITYLEQCCKLADDPSIGNGVSYNWLLENVLTDLEKYTSSEFGDCQNEWKEWLAIFFIQQVIGVLVILW